MTKQEYLEKREGLCEKVENLLKICQKEQRNLTVDEKSTFDKLNDDIDGIERTVEALDSFNNIKDKEIANGKKIDSFVDNKDVKTEGFESFGDMLLAVAKAKSPYNVFSGAGTYDDRLNYLNATGHSSNIPSDGGFLITPNRSDEIMRKIYEGGQVLSRCSIYDIGSNSDSLEIPYIDEKSRIAGSRWGGLRAYREEETSAPTASKTKLGLWECRLSDIKALVYVSERALQDASALQSLIEEQLEQEFVYKLEEEIIEGTGGIQCKGIVGDSATVSVAKESEQGASTILYENIIKMYARAWGKSRPNAVWYINQDIEPQLHAMSLSVGTGGVPVFMPANGISVQGYNTLLGRPIIPIEHCSTVGTVGDIILADMSQYAVIRKGGLKTASSMHVKFIYDEMCFKFNMRANGKPKWHSALTPKKGSNTLSPFVTLATRS